MLYLFGTIVYKFKKAGIVMAKKGIYKVVFVQLGEVYEIYAEAIYQSDMYGFIEVEEYIFKSSLKSPILPTVAPLDANRNISSPD